jgi:hypothetical protein
MKIYFINSKEKSCGVYQYGLRFWEAIKDTKLNVQYFEVSNVNEFSSLDVSDVDIMFFNWIEGGASGPFGWFTHSIAEDLKRKNIITVSILHTTSCFSTSIDYFINQNPIESGMPRPLYQFDTSKPKIKNKIINIGSFGFAGAHKKFPEIVRMVNEQFDNAKININVTNAFYGDNDGAGLREVIEEINNVPRKVGIELNLTTTFMENEALLNFVHDNDLMVFAYDYVGDTASVVDYVISTETPIAVTSIAAFRHVYTEEIDIYKNKLQDILDYNLQTNYVQRIKEEWSTENLKMFFEIAISKIGQKSYAQVCQDRFALELIGTNGFFLDLGAGWDSGILNSNTALLEELGWDGISVEGNPEHAERRKSKSLRSKVVCTYIPETTIKEILDLNTAPKVIDYVSVDIEPLSMVALNNFPFDDYEFKIMTFEHDLYAAGPRQKQEAYDLLTSKGYVRLCNNVNVPEAMGIGLYFEDWWVNPKYFSKEFIENNTFDGQLGTYITSNIRS